MTLWWKNNRCQGLFVAIPGINSHAMGFYREHCSSNDRITMGLLQEPQVLDALVSNKTVMSGEEIGNRIDSSLGIPGDRLLVCSEKGFFWLQYIVPVGAGIASKIQLFDSMGHAIADDGTITYLAELVPEMREVDVVLLPGRVQRQGKAYDDSFDEVVELRGSSACFEYQFPASPQFFVGRSDLLEDIDNYVKQVIGNEISSRGVLFEANSGWGKSSLVLAVVDRLTENGHYAVAIDSRAASTSQFIAKSVEHVVHKFGNFGGSLTRTPIIGGFDGAVASLLDIGENLRSSGRVLVIFFDQFENIFYLVSIRKARI